MEKEYIKKYTKADGTVSEYKFKKTIKGTGWPSKQPRTILINKLKDMTQEECERILNMINSMNGVTDVNNNNNQIVPEI